MDEVLLWQFRQRCVEYICINNYSIYHARLFMMGAKQDRQIREGSGESKK
jgi:hypothetical protein